MHLCGATLLGIFTRGVAGCSKIPLPRRHMLFHPILFVLVVPDVTAKITRARAHIKPVTCAKHISGLEIIRMHDQYNFLIVRYNTCVPVLVVLAI